MRTGQSKLCPVFFKTTIPSRGSGGGKLAGMKESKKRRRIRWRGILLGIFGLIFLASAAVTGWVLISHREAETAIRELRAVANRPVEKPAAITGTTAAAAVSEEQPAENDEPEQKPARLVSMDFTELKQINGDVIGWLYAQGTNIDYPLLQGEDNDYYLERMYNGRENPSGSLFADFRNKGDFSDQNTVIYGHHMTNGTMFGSLEFYRDQDFYEVSPTMMLYTPEGDYLVELICGTDENGYDTFFSFEFESDKEFLEYVESFRSRSTFQSDVVVEPGDRLISLCTCAYVFDNARYVVMGKLIELYEPLETAPELPEAEQTAG